MVTRISISLLLVFTLLSSPLLAEQRTIDKQIQLSHRFVTPYVVSRASNGDFLVAGTYEELGYRPWATRISASGEVRWEFVEGESDRSPDRSIPQQRFNGVIELPDQTTVLCGLKYEDKRATVVLDHFGVDGSLTEQRIVRPSRPMTMFSCSRWNEGIALAGSVFGDPAGTGWLVRIDAQLNLQWEKFGDDYANTDILEGAGGALILTSWSGNINYLVKIGSSGEVLARKALPEAKYKLVHPVSIGSAVSVVAMTSTGDTEILYYDEQLRGPSRTVKLHNAGVIKCLELSDGSIAIFGTQFHNGATGAVTRVYKDGSSKGFLVDPPYQSGWYEDAVLTGYKNQFAAVRLVRPGQGQAVLDWISFK